MLASTQLHKTTKQLRSSSPQSPIPMTVGAGHEINILQICSTKSTKAKTPKATAQSKAYNPFDDSEVPTPVSVDELMTRKPGKGADNPFVDADTTEDGATPNEHEPKLDLPQLQTGLIIAYMLRCTAALYMALCQDNLTAQASP